VNAATGPLAGNDCEAIRAGFLHQPINAWTSLAFLAAGMWIGWRAWRGHPEARAELSAFALIVAANALGSFAYHGPAPTWGRWAHDVTALGIPLFVALHDLGLVRGWSTGRRLASVAVGLSIVGLTLFALTGATDTIATALAVAAVAGEIAAFRYGFRPHPSEGWHAVTIAWVFFATTLALGATAFVLGRTWSPLCDPHGWLQPHGVWHVLAALATAAFAYSSLERGLTPTASRSTGR
jgi:hypothetical protein